MTPYLAELVPLLEYHGHLALNDEVRLELLSMSAATVDRILAPARKNPQALSMTRAGATLKRQIPIRTFTEWEDTRPGFFEADLVCHCGQSTHGAFVCTLTLTDVASGWTEPVALLRRSADEVLQGIEQSREVLPFDLLGIDVDNGSEFINDDLTSYCERNGLTFTRGRPTRKNDQCYVEQKNGCVVRRTVGHDRYEGALAQEQMAELYSVLRLYVNLFQPSMKLASKSRNGAKSTRTYATAKTPLQRLVAANCLSTEQQEQWSALARTLDPVRLLHEIQSLQVSLSKHACKRLAEAAPPAPLVPAKIALVPLRAHLNKPAVCPRAVDTGPTDPRPYARFRIAEDQLFAWFQQNRAITASAMLRLLREAYPDQFPDDNHRNMRALLAQWRKLPTNMTSPPSPGKKGKKGNFLAVELQLRCWLDDDPDLACTELLHRLQRTYPGRYPDRMLRSLQRLLARWRP